MLYIVPLVLCDIIHAKHKLLAFNIFLTFEYTTSKSKVHLCSHLYYYEREGDDSDKKNKKMDMVIHY